MMEQRTIETSQCVRCGGRLRNAVFCPTCGHSSCSWSCHLRHQAEHLTRPMPCPGEPPRAEPMGEQAFAR